MATSTNNELMEIIKEAVDCDEIIIESEAGGSGANEEEEEFEEYEIIEIDETEEQALDNEEEVVQNAEKGENHSINSQNVEQVIIEDDVSNEKHGSQHVVQYHVEEDWEDEDAENVERVDSTTSTQLIFEDDDAEKTPTNQRTVIELSPVQPTEVTESAVKRSRIVMEIDDSQEVSNDGSQNEIIQEENDLVYTILEPKKQNHSYVDSQHKVLTFEEFFEFVENICA